MPHPASTTARMTQAGLNLIGQALSIYDRDLRLAVCNRMYAQMFDLPAPLTRPGVSFEETIRFLVDRGEYGPAADPDAMVAQRVAQARAFEPHYLERRRPNGMVISVEGSPLPEGGWVTVYTDITAIKTQERLLRARSEVLSDQLLARAEELSQANRQLAAANAALEEARVEATEMAERIRLTTEMLPAHIARLDRDRRYTFSNRRLAAVFPGAHAEIVGLTMEDALGSGPYATVAPHLDAAFAGEAPVFEMTHEPSGRRIRVSFTPETTGGEVTGVFALSMDVTEEAQARAALSQAAGRQVAAQLTSGMAHDFANLLTVILGMGDRLRGMDLPPRAREAVDAIALAATRGGTLIDQISGLSGPRDLVPRAVDLRAFLAQTATLAGASLPAEIAIRTRVHGLEEPVLLDPDALRDAILNLVLNARDAIGDGPGAITLTARPHRGTWLEIEVRDTGPGFSEAALTRGAEPFFTEKGEDGTGLGLSMVYDVVKLAGGRTRLANAKGGGALVSLRLPLRAPPPGLPPTMVLLVEDAIHIREAVRDRLVAAGHTVLEAGGVAEAESLLDLDGLGLVLTDIMLRTERTGLDLARAAAARNLPVALMTSLPSDAPLYREAAAGWPLLRKPFSVEKLSAVLA
ncbi:hybrid sensor histidine kinase/response regulator [Jannaschia seohaensis]|uniref:histidine kinase n=1 Tax=Jannaschia seohaensis TaxID=475081 RepID=A0A2Y9B3R0_9RHOB|nr:PAS-domain containing protein [Jannaschia seohaensis]PWJ13309.1 signal transduction histidine kinase [Jannaschia seohaensis]SSA50635.1 Signal transduction histidine kinase [Jannaschia seohaensis]